MNKAIFFDRDGVIIEAPVVRGFPKSIKNKKEVVFLKDIENFCKFFRDSYKLIMITNQPDFKRKKNTKKNIDEINRFLKSRLKLHDVFVCYSDNEQCFNRKPNPGMLIEAKKKHNISINKSYFIGDRWRDIEAGNNVGCKTILIDHHYKEKLTIDPDYRVNGFKEIFNIIL